MRKKRQLSDARIRELLYSNIQNEVPVSPVPEPERMTLTVDEMAKELHLSRTMAYVLTRNPDFPAFTIGRKVLIDRARLSDWVRRQGRHDPLSDMGNTPQTVEK